MHLIQAVIFPPVLQQNCYQLTGKKGTILSHSVNPGWAARLMRSLSDSFFYSVQTDTEVQMESKSTNNS